MAETVTLIMFFIYTAILFLFAKKVFTKAAVGFLAGAAALGYGLLSYGLVVSSFNPVEIYFMDTRGPLHALLVGPVQEEIVKFLSFFLAYSLVIWIMSLIGEESSKMVDSKSWAVLGALVGLGFAVPENLSDYGSLAIVDTFRRTITSWPLHMAAVAISAYGFYKYKRTKDAKMIVLFLSLAILVHVLFNEVMTFIPF